MCQIARTAAGRGRSGRSWHRAVCRSHRRSSHHHASSTRSSGSWGRPLGGVGHGGGSRRCCIDATRSCVRSRRRSALDRRTCSGSKGRGLSGRVPAGRARSPEVASELVRPALPVEQAGVGAVDEHDRPAVTDVDVMDAHPVDADESRIRGCIAALHVPRRDVGSVAVGGRADDREQQEGKERQNDAACAFLVRSCDRSVISSPFEDAFTTAA
jgi:hypothetical protein